MNKKQGNALKEMHSALVEKVGEYTAGTLLAILLDSLNNLVEGVPEREIRTIEITYNGFFSTKYDFAKEEYV